MPRLKFDKRPRKKPTPKRRFSSIKRPSKSAAQQAAQKLREGNTAKRAKREQKNRSYYQSAEWRAKRKAVFERDGYRCVEVENEMGGERDEAGVIHFEHSATRCSVRGEIVNGKQTSKGLEADEESYGHRGIPGAIDRIKTRCTQHHRLRTVLTRANWQHSRRQRGK